MKKCILLLSVTFQALFLSAAFAEELEMVNRPVNISGLTGLLITTAPYTLPKGMVEVGISAISENSYKPYYGLTEYPATITLGIRGNMEIGLRGSYFFRKEEPTKKERGAGDTELSYKWNFMPQPEYSHRPALSLIVAGIAPTAAQDSKMNSVSHWGARAGFSTGTEISWGDHVMAICADAQVAFQDLSDELDKDIYGIINAGALFPISKYRNLQMLIEYTIVTGRNRITVNGGDYSAVTYGLRLVSERFNFTIGTRFVHKELEGYDDSGKVIGMLSMKF